MKETISGPAFVLGDNVDTDQIIPAEYLTYNPAIPEERKEFGKYALVGVPIKEAGLPEGNIPFVKEAAVASDYRVIIAGKNFGCGSSREHAPLAIQESGVDIVIAEFYARIFYRNSVNGGYLLPFECQPGLNKEIKTGDELEINVKAAKLINKTQNKTYELKPLGDVLPILEAGDVFAYAKKVGMLK
jgi:3-isopropylmalate/(R)-2-methylmalate dehydratase small subunit